MVATHLLVVTTSRHHWILGSDWSSQITWPEHWPLICQNDSRLVTCEGRGNVIMMSPVTHKIVTHSLETLHLYFSQISLAHWSHWSRGLNTGLWLVKTHPKCDEYCECGHCIAQPAHSVQEDEDTAAVTEISRTETFLKKKIYKKTLWSWNHLIMPDSAIMRVSWPGAGQGGFWPCQCRAKFVGKRVTRILGEIIMNYSWNSEKISWKLTQCPKLNPNSSIVNSILETNFDSS